MSGALIPDPAAGCEIAKEQQAMKTRLKTDLFFMKGLLFLKSSGGEEIHTGKSVVQAGSGVNKQPERGCSNYSTKKTECCRGCASI